jgi:hypothetical protein
LSQARDGLPTMKGVCVQCSEDLYS